LKILLDESVPHIVKSRLGHLAIHTVQEMGWAGIKNGELLKRAEEQFDVFITADQQLRYQQNLSGRKLAIIVLPTNQVRAVAALLPAIEEALERAQTVGFIEIPLPT
jgi:predicted nuclease of predicted toxin-antitoxin system